MNSLEKHHTGRWGSMQGHRKYSNGFSDTSSVGSFMDETDREVSNLTDRAFRSLCIGEEAIYNDLEISSPTERQKAFAEEPEQKETVKATCQETFSYDIQYREAERKTEVASTFQQSCMDVLRDECLSYMSNGSVEAVWQHRRSTSRVASLIKAFSSGEGYNSTGDADVALSREKSQDFNNESWNKSALICIEKKLPEFSSAYHQNFKTGPFQSYRNHSHASVTSVVQMHTTPSHAKSPKNNFKALSSTNFFFHSEFSPFQLWKDYNRFPFKREEASGFVSPSEFPRWYDTPLYKELTATHRMSSSPSEGRWFNRRKIEDIAGTQRSRSTVIQKASAVEKRCESEITSNCPPWRKNNNFMRNKLPSNRPSTVSPTNEKINRTDSSLFYPSRYAYGILHKVENVGDNEMSSNMIPFSITQLLTPVIHGRQETETSEILQFAHTPSVPDCLAQGGTDMKSLPDVKQLCGGYKAKASSLLFNIKDNRKRVKSTYSPPKCKGSEIMDWNKQPSKLDNIDSKLSDTAVSQMTSQQYSAAPDTWELCKLVQETCDVSQTVEHKEYVDGSHCNMALQSSPSQYGFANCKIPHEDSKGNSLHPNKLSNRESGEYGFLPHVFSTQNKTTKHSDGHIYDPSRTLSPTRPEIDTNLSKAHPPAHAAHMSEKQMLNRKEDIVRYDHKEKNNFVIKQSFGNAKKEVSAEETIFWEKPEPTNITNKKTIDNNDINVTLQFKGEIAALIEMDKQRKANAKQYLPLASDSYTMGKEMYINKVNENIKQGRLAKEEEMQATEVSSQKYPFTGFQKNSTEDHPTNRLAASQNLYEFQNPLNKMTLSSTKETNLNKSSEIQSALKAEVCFHSDMNYPRSDITSEKDFLLETKQNNEGSVTYQPYKYEPNKQWYIATSENKQTKDEECATRQLQQTEKKSDLPGETNYSHSISETSYIQQQSANPRATQINLITEDSSRTGKLKPNDSISPKHAYATKLGDMNSDINKQNIQSTEPNNKSSQTREERFNINDILSIRDNKQAKRVKENKHSLSASEATHLENQPSTFTSYIAEDKEAKMEASKMQEQTLLGQNPCYKLKKTNISSAYIRKDSHNPNEGPVHIGTGLKGKSGKDTFMNKENDRITSKGFSYKERGQTKQEILTSKLKAHAQKEISAIKEKGLAKQGIPSRNPIAQSTAVNYEKGQLNQGVLSLKKEITAEKLDHLFQDITYSSITLYKEQRNQDDGPKYESLEQDMKLIKGTTVSQAEDADSHKNNEAAKDDKLITNQKENGRVQLQDKRPTVIKTGEFQDIHHQPLMQPAETHFNKSGSGNQEEQCTNASSVEDIAVLNKGLSRSPALISLSKEVSVVKTEDQAALHQHLLNSKNHTEYLTFAPMGNDIKFLRYDLLGKTATCKLTPYNNSEHINPLDYSINKTDELLSNVEVDKHIVSSNKADKKCTNLQVVVEETTREERKVTEKNLHCESKNNTGKGNLTKEPSEKIPKMSAGQMKSPRDWTKLKNENLPVDPTVESTNTEAGISQHKASTNKYEEKLKSEADCVSTNEANSAEINSPKIINLVYGEHIPEPKEKKEQKHPEQWAKHDIKLQPDSIAKPNVDSLIQQLHHIDNPKIKACENAHTNKGSENETISNSYKQEGIKTVFDGVNGYSLLKEPKENGHDALQPDKNEIQQDVCHLTQKISGVNNPNKPMRTDALRERNNQQLLENRSIYRENQTPRGKDNHQQEANAPNEKNEDENIGTNRSNCSLKPTETENEVSQEKSYTSNVNINSKDQMTPVKSVDVINPVPDRYIFHIPSKEDDELVDEPVIYSIHVSSQSEIVSEDEPIIFTICVSSISDTPKTDNAVSHNRHSSGQEHISVEGVEKEKISGDINKEIKKDFESKASEIKEEKVFLNSKKDEKESAIRKYNSPAAKDKYDCYRSSEVDNINSSYENINLNSVQKEQDKLQEKEEEEPTNILLQKIQKNTVDNVDCIKRNCQESIKKAPELLPEFLKASEETIEQQVTHITEEQKITASKGTSQRFSGIMSTSEKNVKDKNELISENSRLLNKQGISVKQKAPISNVVPVSEYSQDTKSTIAQKTNLINDYDDGDQLEKNKQVKQNVQIIDCARDTVKENENDFGVNTDMIIMKNVNDNQKITNTADGISSTNNSTSNSTLVMDGLSYEDLCKHTPDAASVQNSQKAIYEAVKKKYSAQEECEGESKIQNKDTALTKDNKSSQNDRKDIVGKNYLSEQEETRFKACDETKGKREIILQNEIPTFANNQMVKESQSVSEHLIKNSSTAMKTDQNLLKVSNISLEEKNMPKMGVELNKAIAKVQEKHLAQDEQIKADSISARCVVLPKNTNENVQCILAKVIGQKSLSRVDTAEDDTKRPEPESTPGTNVNIYVTPVNNKDNTEKALSLVKVGKDTVCESNKSDNKLKERTAQPCYKKEDNCEKGSTGKVRRESGQIKSKPDAVVVMDRNGSIRGKIESSEEISQVKHDDHINVYQYYPGKGFLPEMKGNTYNEPSSIASHHHDTVHKKKDGTITKPDITQKERKTTRPEISALADYARLRVISAEDDSTSEKDLLKKMDPHHKYNMLDVEPKKGLQGNLPMPLGSSELTTKKRSDNQSQMTKPLQIQERDNSFFQRSRITEKMLEGHNQHTARGEISPHPKLSSMTRSSDGRLFAVKETNSTRGKTLTNQMQPNKSLNEQISEYPRNDGIHQTQNPQVTHTLLSQNEGKYDALSRLRQPFNAKLQDKALYPHVKSPESLPQTSVGSQHNKDNQQTENQINVMPLKINDEEKIEELQYYTVNAIESEPKPKDLHETFLISHKTTPKKEVAENLTTKTRSNSSSPAMAKPIMFRVKDNTIRTTSVTKTVKPHFLRSFSEEFRTGSPREMWKCSEKDDLEDNHKSVSKESAYHPVLHEPAVASHRPPKLRETRCQSSLSSADVTAVTEPRGYLRRSQLVEDDDNRSVFSTLSEDVDSLAASTIITTDIIASHTFNNEHNRYTNARPASACYERPESVCYERPESSCSDVRTLGKPPTVPPKTEKALRRAKKLTTRRIKKTEAKTASDSHGEVETKYIQNTCSLSSSPLELMSSHHAVHASPPISHYLVEPNYAPPAPSIVAHPFPLTQRKLLQDPKSGQYFMVDMPVQIKTKMFFDPTTGKYVHLNVHQEPQSTVSQPPSVEVLNQPYIVYPGFLPLPVSSLPSLRSSSQMSAPATLMEQNMVEASSGVQKQTNYHKNAQVYNEPVYRTNEQTSTESVCTENNVDVTQRKTDIITMSELEDFVMEST